MQLKDMIHNKTTATTTTTTATASIPVITRAKVYTLMFETKHEIQLTVNIPRLQTVRKI